MDKFVIKEKRPVKRERKKAIYTGYASESENYKMVERGSFPLRLA